MPPLPPRKYRNVGALRMILVNSEREISLFLIWDSNDGSTHNRKNLLHKQGKSRVGKIYKGVPHPPYDALARTLHLMDMNRKCRFNLQSEIFTH